MTSLGSTMPLTVLDPSHSAAPSQRQPRMAISVVKVRIAHNLGFRIY